MNESEAETLKRKRIYLGLFAVLALAYPLTRGLQWEGTAQLHTLMETVASLLALVVGVIALIRHHSRIGAPSPKKHHAPPGLNVGIRPIVPSESLTPFWESRQLPGASAYFTFNRMTARSISTIHSPKPTRVFLIERLEPLALRIERILMDSDMTIQFNRAPDLPAASNRLTQLDVDMVVVNVDELNADEWQSLAELRQNYPDYQFYGLSGNPQTKSAKAGIQRACDQVFPLTTDLSDLREHLRYQAI